jgi:hypothetical protein
MTSFQWLGENWFTGLQTLGIVASLSFTAGSFRREDRSRRVENLFRLNANHRDIWAQTFKQPELRRVLSQSPNLSLNPVTEDEAQFVRLLILHLNTAHHAVRTGLMDMPEGLGADIRTFFANPIPRAIWRQMRDLQDAKFVIFVERHFAARS